MKFWLVLTTLILPLCRAGHFSQEPSTEGEATASLTPQGTVPTQVNTPVPTPTSSQGGFQLPSFDLEAILNWGPIASAIAKTGVNATERLLEARKRAAETGWDARIPLISDASYKETIVNEALTPDELERRVWFLLVNMPSQDPLSKFVDEKFDEAFNLTHSSPDMALPHVRWGRINYMDVTAITTKWWIWKVPMLVLLRRRGQELRFYSPREIRLQPEVIHKFLQVDGWLETPPWSGPLSPGGSLDQSMEIISDYTAKGYELMMALPRWLVLLATGALASVLVKWLHTQPSARGSPTARGTLPPRPGRKAPLAKGSEAIVPSTDTPSTRRRQSPMKEQ